MVRSGRLNCSVEWSVARYEGDRKLTRQSLRRGVAALAAVAIVGAGFALANSSTWTDGDDAPAGTVDIKTYGHGHKPNGKLVHKVVAFEPFGEKASADVCLLMTGYTNAGNKRHTYQVCGGDESVYDADNHFDPSGDAKVVRPDNKTLKFIFSKGAIDHPAYYKWRVLTQSTKCDDLKCDRVPNVGKKKHNI